MQNNKICMVADIHLGLHQSCEKWHSVCLSFAEWLKKDLKERGINDIVVLGDLMDDRNEISVPTLHIMSLFFDILEDFDITILVGNHDCYYNTRSDIHSLSILKKRKNIKIIDEITTIEKNGKKICMCPWNSDISNIPKCDILMGHFEIVSFKMNGGHVCKKGLESASLLDKSDIVFSGHFHKTENRKYKKGKIIYVGSPFEQNWGECDQEKGIYLLDLDNNEVEFVENTESPKHLKVKISDILNKKEDIRKITKNNILSLVIDNELKQDDVDLLSSKLYSFNPFSLKIGNIQNDDVVISTDEDIEYTDIDIKQSIIDYIQKIDQITNKEEYIEYLTQIYDRSRRGK